jgi:TRAP-type C4-dicarboxylate transport system permease small subunit
MRFMRSLSNVLGIVFGWLTMLLGLIVTTETITRKLFNWSMQGADELGGYILAFTACLSFCVALIGRNHMRIDLIHYNLTRRGQAILNWIAIMSIALFSFVLAWASFGVIRDTFLYNSTAPTPWATPLKYPQTVWYVGILAFTAVALVLAARATQLLVTNRMEELATEFEPKAAKEELQEELESAAARAAEQAGTGQVRLAEGMQPNRTGK